MEIEWMLFGPALLLLFYPLNTLLQGRMRLRNYEGICNDSQEGGGAWWRQPWVWMDSLRGFAGGWALVQAVTVDAWLPGPWQLAAQSGVMLVLVLAVGVQMHTRRIEDTFFAPVGFSVGLLFAIMPPAVAVLAVILAGACLMALRGWWAFFLCGGLAAGALGYLITGLQFWAVAAVVLMLEPLLLDMLTGRELRLPVMRKSIRVKSSETGRKRRPELCVEELTHQTQ